MEVMRGIVPSLSHLISGGESVVFEGLSSRLAMLPQHVFVRIVVLAGFTLVLFLLYSNASLLHGYVARVGWHKGGEVAESTPAQSTSLLAGGKVIVMGKLQHEDTSWVQEYLPE